jgi:hypothetical protein
MTGNYRWKIVRKDGEGEVLIRNYLTRWAAKHDIEQIQHFHPEETFEIKRIK